FVHGGDLWRLNTPLSCLQPPQQGKTLLRTSSRFSIMPVKASDSVLQTVNSGLKFVAAIFNSILVGCG
uniref:hypothetical protein n=1 Tax=Enterobacter hormaechei TaxID=158836 RepID=UPI001F19CCDE